MGLIANTFILISILLVGGKGVIYQVIRDIYITHSNDSGRAETFVPPVRVHVDNWYMNGCPSAGPALGFDSNGTLHVSWFTGGEALPGTYHANSTDSGKNFTKSLLILVDKWVPTSQTNLAIDGRDNVWITTTDGRNDTDTLVFVAVKLLMVICIRINYSGLVKIRLFQLEKLLQLSPGWIELT